MKTKKRSAVRSTRTWSWSGEGALLTSGRIVAWVNGGKIGFDRETASGGSQIPLDVGAKQRSPRTVSVLVKATEVKR